MPYRRRPEGLVSTSASYITQDMDARHTVALRPSAARDLEHCNEVLVQALAAAGALVALSEGRVETVERDEWVNFVDSQRIAPAMSRHDIGQIVDKCVR
jgi:tellurite resistance protein